MSIWDLLGVLGYTATIFGLGNMMGKDARKQKKPPKLSNCAVKSEQINGPTVYR